jgi:hypothetical protein
MQLLRTNNSIGGELLAFPRVVTMTSAHYMPISYMSERALANEHARSLIGHLLARRPPIIGRDAKENHAVYEALSTLQSRFSAGHNRNVLQAKFGKGVLALVTAGNDTGFSNT